MHRWGNYVNPACAGMIRDMSRKFTYYNSKPRVCGDDPTDTNIRPKPNL